jgi:hypothetical protein
MCLGKDSDKVVSSFKKDIVDIKEVIPNEVWIGKYNQSTVIGLSHPSWGAWNKHYDEYSQALREIIEHNR